MNKIIPPSACCTCLSTPFKRSSNSPRYFAPAISAPISSSINFLSLSPSGTSPCIIRHARPSTIAVLPTPGSPMRTGLFFVLRERISITLRISSSLPITGSIFPSFTSLTKSCPYLLNASSWLSLVFSSIVIPPLLSSSAFSISLVVI